MSGQERMLSLEEIRIIREEVKAMKREAKRLLIYYYIAAGAFVIFLASLFLKIME